MLCSWARAGVRDLWSSLSVLPSLRLNSSFPWEGMAQMMSEVPF